MSKDQIKERYPDFYLTQTSTKDLEKNETCPTRWKGLWLDKTISFPSNEAMDRGKYFEWLSLGGGAINDQEVTDLPRLNNGSKSLDQVRIDKQADRFKDMFNTLSSNFQGFELKRSQIELKDNESKLKGTIDFETLELATGDVWINDLKLTKDLTSTRTQYGWGNSWDEIDMLQMIHYRDLYYKAFGIIPRTALWVFDYSAAMRVRIGEIIISNKAVEMKDTRFNAVFDVLKLYEDNGWTTTPSENECRTCTLKCDARFSPISPIERVVINI